MEQISFLRKIRKQTVPNAELQAMAFQPMQTQPMMMTARQPVQNIFLDRGLSQMQTNMKQQEYQEAMIDSLEMQMPPSNHVQFAQTPAITKPKIQLGMTPSSAADYFELDVDEPHDWDIIQLRIAREFPELYEADVKEFLTLIKTCPEPGKQKRMLAIFGIQ